MQDEQAGTRLAVLPESTAEAGCPGGAKLIVTAVPEPDRVLQAVRELHDLELLAGVER